MLNLIVNRRQALLGASALGASALGTAVFPNRAWAQALSDEDRPNFLCIVSEDNHPRWIGALEEFCSSTTTPLPRSVRRAALP